MVLFQRNQNVRVACADQTGGAVHKVDLAIRQADVVEHSIDLLRRDIAPNGIFDQVAEPRRFLDACTCAAPAGAG